MKKQYEVLQDSRLCACPVFLADTFPSRFRGLMLRSSLEPGEGLFLKHCGSIHCFFMSFPIDVVYLDRDLTVLRIETVPPWHIGSFVKGAKHVLELEEGKAASLCIGSRIELKERDIHE